MKMVAEVLTGKSVVRIEASGDSAEAISWLMWSTFPGADFISLISVGDFGGEQPYIKVI